jgi:hypothetical protein
MKTPAQIGQDIKQQYPGDYDQYPDELVGQRALVKNPSLGDSSMGDVAVDAVKEATFQPGTNTNDLLTNPITQAKALPSLMGATGAVTGIPMGGSLGTGIGNLISDAALKAYGRPDQIPSTKSQVLGTAGAAIGDLAPVPAMNRKIFGGQVGEAETAAGVPPPQDIPSLPKPSAGQPVSGGIDDTINAVKRANEQGAGSPVFWKQIKDQIDSFYNLGKDAKLTTADSNKLAWLNGAVQNGLNASVPGRAAPAASLAMSQTVPNAIAGASKAIPWWGKAIGSAVGGDALLNALKSAGSGNK